MEMLTPIGLACRMEEKLRPEATLLLLDHAEDICRWIDYWCSYLDTPGSIQPMAAAFRDTHMVFAKALFVVADADPRVLDALLSFPKFYDVVVRLWTAEFEGEVIASSALLGICPIIGTLKSVIGNDHGLETLANKLLARRSLSIGCVRAFKNRVALASSSDKAPNVKLQHLNSLGSAADGFLILPGRFSDFRRLFARVKYHTQFMEELSALSTQMVERGESGLREDLSQLAKTTYDFITLLWKDPSLSIIHTKDIATKDALGHLGRLLAHLPEGDRQSMDTTSLCLSQLGSYTSYFPIARDFKFTLTPDYVDKRVRKIPVAGSLWDNVRELAEGKVGMAISGTHSPLDLCDNLSVR
jgi:hypothetical protein